MSVPITQGTGASSVAAELVGGLNYQQIEMYGAGGASVLGINPDGSIKASIIGTPAVTISGTPTVTLSGSPSISGAVTVIGTPSISGAVQIAGNSPSSVATVQQIGTQVISSSFGLVTNAVLHGLTSAGGGTYVDVKVDPSGALTTTVGSVLAFQAGTQITSISGTVPVSVIGTVPITGNVGQTGTIITSVSGAVTINPASVSGTVGASIIGQLPAGNAVIGAVAASISGTVPVTVTGSVLTLNAPTASLVSGVTSVITGTASVQVLAAAPGAQRNYISQILITNGAATGTFVDVVDNGQVIYSGFAAASGGGFSASFNPPLKQPTSVLAVYVAPRAQASIIAGMSGYTAS